jgi:hypothetical protein
VRLVGTLWAKGLLILKDNYKLWVRKEMEQIGSDPLNCYIVLTLHKREHDDRVRCNMKPLDVLQIKDNN